MSSVETVVTSGLEARRLRILHLEDSRQDAAMILDRLHAGGVLCDVVVVDSQHHFESALGGGDIDLILSDYTLPSYDGVTALKFAQLHAPHIPVILVSGTVGEETAVQCLQFGATDYLLKARLERLVPAVRRALEEAGARRGRAETAAALRESESRKAAILDSVLDCIITMDPAGIVIEFNAAAVRTFGYAKSEAVGRPLADLIIPPKFREMHAAGLARYLATGETTLIGRLVEVTALRADGSEIPVELAITAVGAGPNAVFTGVLRDITARRQAETTLRQERDRVKRYLDVAEVILLTVNTEGRITLVNRYACSILGWTAEELIGQDWIDKCLPVRIRAAMRSTLQQVMDGAPSLIENPILTKSGTERLIEWRSVVLRDDAGQVQGTLSSGTDITERSVAAAAHSQAEERMRFALQGADVGIWDMNYATGLVEWSAILESQYCMEPGTFDGRFESFIEHVHPDDRASLSEAIGKATESGGDFTTLNRTICPDGTVRWLSGAGRVHLGDGGEPIRAVGISLNITERHLLEEQYQQAQKMEAVGRLASGVAHDFNNLLTVILGFCNLLLSGLEAGDERRNDLTQIQSAGERAAGLTRQLLTFSRKEIIQPTLLDLNVIVTDIRSMLARLIGEDVTVVLALEPALAPILADRGQVEQIVLNLAVNARDAMPDGGTLTIQTSNVKFCVERGKAPKANATPCVALTVTDTGTGMTQEVKARLFEPFFTTKGVGKGTGLGLATVHGVVHRSGGSVTVDSELGKGTSFNVYFPKAEAPAPVIGAVMPAVRPNVGVHTILVVEDETALRELTKRLLERMGYTVRTAANGEEARILFREDPAIDLLLTDVVMPGASGPALVLQLLAQRPALKVVYMSGYTDDAIVHHGVLDPGIAFLHKPFSSETLEQKVREVFNQPAVA